MMENPKTNNILNDSIEYITRVNRLKELVNTAIILKLKVVPNSKKNYNFSDFELDY